MIIVIITSADIWRGYKTQHYLTTPIYCLITLDIQNNKSLTPDFGGQFVRFLQPHFICRKLSATRDSSHRTEFERGYWGAISKTNYIWFIR